MVNDSSALGDRHANRVGGVKLTIPAVASIPTSCSHVSWIWDSCCRSISPSAWTRFDSTVNRQWSSICGATLGTG